ncbi:MAG: dinitrogenase iron-molybdenum cofactor biosynthesis protein [Deltaproteobacteria bacterium]|nr:dinitrogenase iron-molybdenum cofactor biosynthesis protein [Deltaproteobacteria bacterium]
MSINRGRVAVTSTGPTLEDTVESRFGRCGYFLIIDPDSLDFESVENPNIMLGGGAGIQSAQLMANKGVSVVLTGNCGPNAFQTFGAAGIRVITGITGQVRRAVERFKAGELSPTSSPSVQGHFGMGSRGMGGGMGRGRFMTGGRIAGQSGAGSASRKGEIARLREQAEEMRKQIEAIELRLREIVDK